jgi:hypothetical protein
MRIASISLLCLAGICASAQSGQAPVPEKTNASHPVEDAYGVSRPQNEPSVADQAKAAAQKKEKESARKATLKADNDSIEKQRNAAHPIPELGSPDVTVTEVLRKMVEYKDKHSKDDAKAMISGWFTEQDDTLKQLRREQELNGRYIYTPTSKQMDPDVFQVDSRAKDNIRGLDNRRWAELLPRIGEIDRQLTDIRAKAPQRGIPADWVPKAPDDPENH